VNRLELERLRPRPVQQAAGQALYGMRVTDGIRRGHGPTEDTWIGSYRPWWIVVCKVEKILRLRSNLDRILGGTRVFDGCKSGPSHRPEFSYRVIEYSVLLLHSLAVRHRSVLICFIYTIEDVANFLIIVPDGGMLLEAAGIADILMHANRLKPADSSKQSYEVTIATTQPHRVVHGQSGLNLLADYRLSDLDPELQRDTIMITGKGITEEENACVAAWVRRAALNARRVVSVCAGALLLAQAGLLNGRRATTHWRLLDTLQSRFPKVRVERGPIYVQDGSIWTSGGVSSGFDLTLAFVEDDHGFTLARDVAQDLVMYLRRPGGQSQFSRCLLNPSKKPGPIRDLQSWIHENLGSDLSVEKLADRVAMSPRNFTRVFTRETDTPPAKYVEQARLSAARQRLEQGTEGVEQVAVRTGFGNSLNLRRVFERNLHLTPTEYRERFSSRILA
jgi:transcriptional regulator GlxA family with amidase domain